MTWILTRSGAAFDLRAPDIEQIRIVDIATALSHVCRFGGHTRAFYSVAEHCVRASLLVDDEIALEVLMHDAAEAYVGDMVTPLKDLLPAFHAVELGVRAAIWKRFDLRLGHADAIRHADLVMLATERRDLLPDVGPTWPCLVGIAPQPDPIMPRTSRRAADEFLARFDELYAAREMAA